MLLCVPAPAGAAALETVLQDDAQLLHRPEDQLRRSLEEMRLLGVDRIRVTAGWSVLTRDADKEVRPAFDATDPRAYEQERWRNLDRLLILAREYGFKTMVDIAFWAPAWASTDAPGERGRTNVDVEQFRQFSVAVARRYSGSFILPRAVAASGRGPLSPDPSNDERFLSEHFGTVNPEGSISLHDVFGLNLLGLREGDPVAASLGAGDTAPTAALPKVDHFTLWNEPNHTSFMRPQWVRHKNSWLPHSPHVYRAMVQTSYPSIKAVRPDATILIGGTSFTGSYRRNGTGNVPPLRFLRELACVDRELRPLKRSGCENFSGIPGDGYSHHPYTMDSEPDARAKVGRPDDLPIADLPRLAKLIDQLIARRRLAPAARNLWITEYGYETNPPVKGHIFSVGDQAKFLTWAEYLTARVPTARSFAQFLLRDLPPSAFRVGSSRKRAFGQWQSGLLFEDGRPKLGAYSFRAGVFVQELPGRRLRLWGRLRVGAGIRTVSLETRPAGSHRWRGMLTTGPGQRSPADRFAVDGKDAFTRFAPAPRGKGWRYRLRYLDGDVWRTSPSVASVER